jgi:ubiquitin-protein ligase
VSQGKQAGKSTTLPSSSVVAALATSPALLAVLLQRAGEAQGFSAASDSTQQALGDSITQALKRGKELALIKKEAQRKAAEAAEAEEKETAASSDGIGALGLESSNATQGKAASGDKQYWTAGTGYSYDGQKGLRNFDSAALETKREQRQGITASVLALLGAVIKYDSDDSACGGPASLALLACVQNSPIIAVLASFLRSTEIDISKQAMLHNSVYFVCRAICQHKVLHTLVMPAPGSSTGLAQLLEDSRGIADDMIAPGADSDGAGAAAEAVKALDPTVKAAMLALQAAATAASEAVAVIRAELATAAPAAASAASAAAADEDAAPGIQHGLQALKDMYVGAMKKLTFGKEDMTKTGAFTSFKYRTSVESESKPPAARVTATKQQLRSLKGNMPLDYDATVFLRHDKRRPYVMEFMIAAPPDTPYDSGLFLFHLYCDPQFPKESPKVNLQTTGGGSVRFNPNLYASGKVCLSLLGTWHGGNSREAWTPDSTLLQVLVSIMALIFVQYPYYNEPGVEKEQGTDRGLRNQRVAENGGYERLRVGTVQWAMLDMLKNPPKGFEAVVQEHFRLKRPHIVETCQQWLKEASDDGTVGQHAKLKRQVDALEVELKALGESPAEVMLKPVPTAAEAEAAAAAAEAAAQAQAADAAQEAAAAATASAANAAVAASKSEAAQSTGAAAALSPEAESLRVICPQFPGGMYTYALEQNKHDMEAAAMWLVEKGEAHFTTNAAKYLI